MIGDGHEIERYLKMGTGSAGQRNLITLSKTICHAGIISISRGIGVEGVTGVDVQVAEIGVAQRIWRGLRAAGVILRANETCKYEDEQRKKNDVCNVALGL